MNKNGFTLVELLAVLVILGIIVVVAIPTVSSTLEKQNDNDLEHRQEQIVSEVEIKLSEIRPLLINNSCCSVESLKNLGIIKESQAKDISGGVGYNENHEVVFIKECNNVCIK